jgi:hypothetical protein
MFIFLETLKEILKGSMILDGDQILLNVDAPDEDLHISLYAPLMARHYEICWIIRFGMGRMDDISASNCQLTRIREYDREG